MSDKTLAALLTVGVILGLTTFIYLTVITNGLTVIVVLLGLVVAGIYLTSLTIIEDRRGSRGRRR